MHHRRRTTELEVINKKLAQQNNSMMRLVEEQEKVIKHLITSVKVLTIDCFLDVRQIILKHHLKISLHDKVNSQQTKTENLRRQISHYKKLLDVKDDTIQQLLEFMRTANS